MERSVKALTVYPETIQEILDDLENAGDWGEVYWEVTDKRDRQLTESLLGMDADFIFVDKDVFVFAGNNETCKWEVYHLSEPVYEVEAEMLGDRADEIDFEKFLEELQCQLPGVEIKRGSAINNDKSKFVEFFRGRLNRAVAHVLEKLQSL